MAHYREVLRVDMLVEPEVGRGAERTGQQFQLRRLCHRFSPPPRIRHQFHPSRFPIATIVGFEPAQKTLRLTAVERRNGNAATSKSPPIEQVAAQIVGPISIALDSNLSPPDGSNLSGRCDDEPAAPREPTERFNQLALHRGRPTPFSAGEAPVQFSLLDRSATMYG